MKKRKLMLPAALLLCAGAVSAQSNVTVYGVVDAGVRYETQGVTYGSNGAPVATGSKLSMTKGGGLTESYWGLKGMEDIGSGTKALFQVQSHFDPSSGSVSPKGSSTFFQLAYVGLQSSSLGQFTFGRQYNVLLEGVSMVYGSNFWAQGADTYVNLFKPEVTLMGGSRANNMVHYAAQLNDVVLLAEYAFGEKAGSASAGSQIGASLAYIPENGPIKVSGSFLRSKDDNTSGKVDQFSVGAQLKLGSAIFNTGYFENRRDNNFTSFANGPFGPIELAGLGIISPVQTINPDIPGGFSKRKMIIGGASYDFTPALTLAANAWFTKQTGYTPEFDGSANQYQLVAGYRLSKRTTLYAEVSNSRYHGGLVGAQLVGVNGQSPTVSTSQTAMMVGVRHAF